MTRENAILCLKGIKNYGRDTFTEQSDWQDSLDMAIKALEQESILDKIRAELTEKRDILAKEARANAINPLSCYGLEYALLVIDKYKAESEET